MVYRWWWWRDTDLEVAIVSGGGGTDHHHQILPPLYLDKLELVVVEVAPIPNNNERSGHGGSIVVVRYKIGSAQTGTTQKATGSAHQFRWK